MCTRVFPKSPDENKIQVDHINSVICTIAEPKTHPNFKPRLLKDSKAKNKPLFVFLHQNTQHILLDCRYMSLEFVEHIFTTMCRLCLLYCPRFVFSLLQWLTTIIESVWQNQFANNLWVISKKHNNTRIIHVLTDAFCQGPKTPPLPLCRNKDDRVGTQ